MTETRRTEARRSRAAEEPQASPTPQAPPLQAGFVRRHPVALTLGALLALVMAAAGYLYWEHESHFETTDDAFIDARQYAIAPSVIPSDIQYQEAFRHAQDYFASLGGSASLARRQATEWIGRQIAIQSSLLA